MNNFNRLISYFLIGIFSLVNITSLSAQTVPVLGEIRSSGKVFIASSIDKWSPAMQTYPLLQGTGIRTEDGTVSVFLKDGSRMDLSRDTTVSISGDVRNYSVHLAKGTVTFNITATSTLSVATPSASISVNSKEDIVRKVGYEKPVRVLGIISVTEKGTEVRDVAGRIAVLSSSLSVPKILVTGESSFIGADNTYKVYKTQARGVYTDSDSDKRKKGAFLWLGAVAGESAVLYGLNQAFPGHGHGIASASGFGH